jgi:aminoglycoside 6-adenylyltransferase
MDQRSRQQWLEQFLEWATAQPDQRGVLLVGSGSRSDHPADEWSDFDLLLVAADPRPYLDAAGWLARFGNPLFSIVERTAAGEPWVRRAFYEVGLDVDFIVLSPDSVRQNFPGNPVILEILGRGRRVLLDKDGLFSALPGEAASQPALPAPTAEEFSEVVQDFWFHAAWMAKKLRRGELWVAVTCNNAYMKRLLLRMIEWHAQAVRGPACDVWFDGRFIEGWAAPEVVGALPGVLAHYEAADVWRALQASMDLFQRIARQTAAHWRLAYPESQVEKVMAWVAARLVESTLPK